MEVLGKRLTKPVGPSGSVTNEHFGTSAEMSWVRSVLGSKCPYTDRTTAP